MQPSSSLEGSSEGIESASTSVRSLGIPNQAVASQQVEISDSQHQQALLFNQADQNQPIMDELFDNMLSISSWSDVGTMRSNWEYTTSSGNGLDDLLQSNQKPFNATSLLARALDTHSTNAQNKGTTNGIENTQIMGGLGFRSDDPMLSSQLSGIQLLASPQISQFNNQQASLQNCGIMSNQDADAAPSGPQDARPELGLNHDSTNSLLVSAPSVSGFASIGDSCAAPPLGKPGGGVAEGSTCQQVALDSSSTLATNWRQSYMSGISSIPLCLGQVKQETFLPRDMPSHDLHLLGRKDAEEKLLRERLTPINRDSSQGGLFNVYGGSHLNQVQMPRTGQVSIHQGNPASSQGPQSGRVTVQAYRNQTTMSQPQPMNPMPGPARPRVRARRGQATDPHSIAERLRRERIAERMKALQELVPNANKTDKASMLDEIIEYVKFLQLQVKVLSMSRLGGAGAVPSLVSDVTAEGHSSYLSSSVGRNSGATGPGNDLAFTERQVARLMEEDMGSAMQFLQSKGFCLMPISLASAISSTKGSAALQSIGSGDKQRTETSTIVSSTPMVVNAQVSSISANGVGNGSENGNGKTTIIGATKDSKDLDKVSESRQLVKSPKSIQKSNDDSSRRPQ